MGFKTYTKKSWDSLKKLMTTDGNASFLRAARAGNLEKVLEYLKGSTDINTSNANGLNALHLASKEGHVNVVTELLKRGANVDAATKKGNTALHIASLAGQEEIVKILVQHSASVNVQSQNGFTPLYMAAQENHDNVVKFLLANGANQSLATEDGFTPLAVALQQGHDKVVAVLLENDTRGKVRLPALHIAAKKDDCKAAALLLQNDHNPDVTSKSGFTPLHIAAHYGNENIANLLLQRGADVNFPAKHNISPLHVASKWGKTNMVSLLLDKGANLELKTRDGLTPLHCAARSGHDQVVDQLLEKGAPITAKTKNGLAPLHMAAQGDHVDSARILLYHKAPVDDVTVDYLTALHVAAHCGHVGVAKLLLDRKAGPNARALNGFTPLHIACKKNRIKVVELLLKHGASIEATTEEQQTPLHIAARLGNSDIVALLLQHGASVDATTKDMYTALHIAAKEGQEEVASVLLEHGASLTATTKKGFTPLHLAAKYGNMKVARLLLQRDAPVDAQGKNGVTPLHVAAHYDNQNVALLLLDKGASPHATAKNGYTPLHIAAKKNQMDIATTLLEYGAKSNAESKAGFTPLHLAAQEGHTDMSTLLIEHQADVNSKAKNGLTPLHLCAQEDKVNVAAILVKSGAEIDSKTKAGYTPLHVACHFGQMNMVRFLLQHGADVNVTTAVGYTPLHQASQQGHTQIVNLLLENRASPNAVTNQGQTALSIAQRLGYISVVETLKIVTETVVTTTVTTVTEEKYRVVAPETMQETFMSDSEDEGEDTMLGDQSYRYLTVDEMKSLGDDSLPIDPTRDERHEAVHVITKESLLSAPPPTAEEDQLSPQPSGYAQFTGNYAPDNIDISRSPVHAGFLVSFMVDARGGAMRGCRHSGVRVIIPPRKAPMPMRITCRYLKKEKLAHPPPLMEGEACASRILEMGPSAAKFLGPVIIEVPHFASLRGKEREITILRSDNGETWREHTLEASEEAVQEVLNESFDGEELSALEDLNTNRITRILTTDFPQYFAIITRIRQEVHAIGPEGGMVSSTVVPQVQAVFPEGALTKKIKVGLQAQPIPADLVAKMLGNRVAVSPVVTVEPRRRKFHKPITLTIPVPQAAARGMINQYSGDAPTLRLLCSITGGTTRAQWEDVTGSTPLTFVNDCVSFTTTVSARFWLMDCRNISEATKMATELYREAIHVPFMAKFVVFAKRHDPLEAKLRVFCMTDDKEDKTLESQEHFIEVAKSRDVEVSENKPQYVEFAGNLVPVTKSGEQLSLNFHAFRENRLPFVVRVKDPHQEPLGRIAFMREAKVSRGEPPQSPICNLNITLPEINKPEPQTPEKEVLTLEKKYAYLKEMGISKPETIHKAELRLSDIAHRLGNDWVVLALQLDMPESDINLIKSEYPDDVNEQAMVMLRLWMQLSGNKATGNTLEKALRKINREDIVNQCIFNVELVTDDMERAVAKVHLDQSDEDEVQSSKASVKGDEEDNEGNLPLSAKLARKRPPPPPPPPPPEPMRKEKPKVPERPKIIGELRKTPSPLPPGLDGTASPLRPLSVNEEIIVPEVKQPIGVDTWVSPSWSDTGRPEHVPKQEPISDQEALDELEKLIIAHEEAQIEKERVLLQSQAEPESRHPEIDERVIAEIHKVLIEDGGLSTFEVPPTPPQRKKRRSGVFGPDAVSTSTPNAGSPTPPATTSPIPKTVVTLPSLDYEAGDLDGGEAARLAESETWTSQELDRSTPDVLERVSAEPQRQVQEKEWVETTDSGEVITRRLKTVKTTYEGSDLPDDIAKDASEKDSNRTSRTIRTSAGTFEDEGTSSGIVEDTVPFAESKDFFQKLVDTNGQAKAEVTSPSSTTTTVVQSVTSSKESSGSSRGVVQKKTTTTTVVTTSSSSTTSPASAPDKEEEEGGGEVVEEVVPFKERVEFFRRSLEESAMPPDMLERVTEKARRPPPPERPPPPRVQSSPTSQQQQHERPVRPPPPLSPPADDIGGDDGDGLRQQGQQDPPVPPPRRSKQQLQLSSTTTTTMMTVDEQQVTQDESEMISPFTPDLETPNDTPDMAEKSDEQKLIMVTERVAEAATTLASSLEEATLSSSQKSLTSVGDDDEVSATAQGPPEAIEKIEKEIDTILTMVQEQEDQLMEREEQWEQVEEQVKRMESDVEQAEKDAVEPEVVESAETAAPGSVAKKHLMEDEDYGDDGDAADTDSAVHSAADDDEGGKAIKAEIRLLVKTVDAGKEAIEIRSIREFVETGESSDVEQQRSKLFRDVISPTGQQRQQQRGFDEQGDELSEQFVVDGQPNVQTRVIRRKIKTTVDADGTEHTTVVEETDDGGDDQQLRASFEDVLDQFMAPPSSTNNQDGGNLQQKQ